MKAAETPSFRAPPPSRLGEHTQPALWDLLGQPPERIDTLRREHVIG